MVNNQKGTIVTFVVVIIGIVGLLYISTYVLIGMEHRIHYSLINRTKAFYIAESGLERGEALLKQNIVDSFMLENPFPEYKDFHRIEVTITEVQPNIYKITSTGTYKNTKRTMEAVIYKTEDEFSIQSWKEID